MKNLRTLPELINENHQIYDKDKLYSYKFVTAHLKKGPMYMKKLIPTLKQIEGTNKAGEKVMKTKITEKIFAFIYNKNW